MAITDLIYGLTPHLQQNQMIKSMAMPRMNLSSEDYNVISSMNAANNMNAGITSLFGPAALYTLGDTISNPNQNFMEGLSDFGRYMKGVQIADNPGLARKLMGNAYVNDMQSKYDRAMNEIGLFTPSRTPMMDITNQDLDPVLEQFYSSPKINKPTSVFSQQPFNDYYGPTNIDTSFGVANEEDVEEDVEGARRTGGIEKLFEFLGNIPTPFNLARRGLESLRGFNQRIRNNDFARSQNLAEYFDRRSRAKNAARMADKYKEFSERDPGDRGKGMESSSAVGGVYGGGPGGLHSGE